ncbi:MAG: BMP family ABC transporter substrate-binding protein, partial [Hyphomicrobiales bacterium]
MQAFPAEAKNFPNRKFWWTACNENFIVRLCGKSGGYGRGAGIPARGQAASPLRGTKVQPMSDKPMMISKRMRLKLLAALALGVATAPLMSGAALAEGDLKVAMILPGPISDNDWNAGGYAGLQAAAENLGIEVAYSENVADADAERVMRDYASRGYGLIFAHSFSYGDATLAVAED